MNLPNLLTLIRILLTPLLVILLINSKLTESFIIFTIAGITDGLDGLIARLMRQKTRIGSILDPIADKLLLNSTYVTLAVIGFLPGWLAITVISRDIIIVFGVLILFLFQGGVEIHPSMISKITTVTQLGTIFIILANHNLEFFNSILPYLYIATALITIISGLHYMYCGIQFWGVDEKEK